MPSTDLALLAACIGNTNTRFGTFSGLKKNAAPADPVSLPSRDSETLAAAIIERAQASLAGAERAAIVLASVNDPIAERIEQAVRAGSAERVYRIGRDLLIPIERALAPESTPGQDRLLAALAAYELMEQAVVVVDAGTAVTVDFVDGQGVFQGGAIAPGLRTCLQSLHQHTASLPLVDAARPDAAAPFGKNTEQAIRNGCYWSIRGLVRLLTEHYAEAYDAYPPVIACGGDAELLFAQDELVDRIIPDLVLMGIAAACREVMLDEPEEED